MSSEQGFIISFCTILLVGIASPGPGFLVTMKNAVTYSKSVAMMSVVGIATANSLFTTLALSGFTFILKEPVILSTLYILGGTYLLYLAYRLFRIKPMGDIKLNTLSDKRDCTFRSGFILQLYNPKAIFLISSAVSVSIPQDINISISVIMISMTFIISFLWYGGIVMIINYQKIRDYLLLKIHLVNKLSSLIIFFMAMKIYYSAMHLI
ncbi:LysE family translocator [Photorhabdus tasmaniensis]|uniref:LysE family translocator n=1 Tax=Photorhabdus tasmaniensis TaxID=1004159 RepID=UPI0040439443